MAVNLHTTHYRFGVEELLEATHGWHAVLDANPAQGVIANDTTFLLRFTVQETGGTAAGNTDQQFQYNHNAAGWVNITTTSAVVKAVVSVAFTNGQACTKRLTGTGTFETSGAGCTEDGSSGGPANDIAASGNSETECALQIVGTAVGPGDTIQFRLTSPDFTITNDVVPTLTTAAAADHPLNAEPGAYSLTGAATTLVRGFLLDATAGSYSLTGATATLLVGRVVDAVAGNYALSGQAATVLAGRVLSLDPGSYAVTGADATLGRGRELNAEAGSYVLSGADARLVATQSLDASSGAYTLTGLDATLLVDRLSPADLATYLLTGFDATLTYSGDGGGGPKYFPSHSTVFGTSPNVGLSL